MRYLRKVPIIVLLATVCGCNQPKSDPFHADHPQTKSAISGHDADAVWDGVQDSLRRLGYRLDRVDREAGIVTTKPETSQHYFEFWRRDVATRADFLEATLNTVQRWVEVSVSPASDGSSEVAVVVHKERLSSPDRQFNNTGSAYKYFGEELPSTTGKEKVTAADDRWIDRGRDLAMEQYLLASILERVGQQPG